MSTAWKALELRICRALGGQRGGPQGAAVSDCINVPFSVEIKRSSRPGPPVLSNWILQARAQGAREHKPWLVVVAGHNDRRPIVTMDFSAFAQLAQEAGRIPTPITQPPIEGSTMSETTETTTETTTTTQPDRPDIEDDDEDEGDAQGEDDE